MSETEALAERVAQLEQDVRHLKTRMAWETNAVSGRTAPDFLERFSGIFGNDPTFPEAERLGQEWRNTDKPGDDAEKSS